MEGIMSSTTHLYGKESRGKSLLLKYRERRRRLTRSEAIVAKCHECSCGYLDRRDDCKIPECPLYPWMPYRNDNMRLAQKKIAINGYGKGRAELKKYREGKKLTRGQAIIAKCYLCMNGNRYDCEIPECPLYPYMPYRGKEPPSEIVSVGR